MAFVAHVRGKGFDANIPTIITEFSANQAGPSESARVQGMERMVNILKGISVANKIVAWFWYPGRLDPWDAIGGLVDPDNNHLTDLGIKYKELAGA